MISDVIKNNIQPLFVSETGINALSYIGESGYDALPVINEKCQFIGIIQEKHILAMNNIEVSISSIQNYFQRVFAETDTHLFEIINIFSTNDFHLLPVVNKSHNYIGYITSSDIFAKLDSPQHFNSIKCIVTVSMAIKDYSLNHISRLIEENNGKIVSLLSEINKKKIHLHLLIDCLNPQRVIQTLERHSYSVEEKLLNKSFSSHLDERFESFLKYLNT
ncbi:MAG: hypothetical protein CMP65_03800 [Flavobacteriales bacterium]|nr:hypothetical protein [Flavobacteriales bacterium]